MVEISKEKEIKIFFTGGFFDALWWSHRRLPSPNSGPNLGPESPNSFAPKASKGQPTLPTMDQLMGQSFNMEQAQMMTQSMQDTVTIVLATSIPDPIAAFCEPTSHHPQVQTMKDAKVAMEAQFKNVKIGDIEVVFATCSASQLPPCWFAHTAWVAVILSCPVSPKISIDPQGHFVHWSVLAGPVACDRPPHPKPPNNLWVVLSWFHWWQWQELSYSINFFVGDQPIIKREMEGSVEGEVSLKKVKDTVLPMAKQMLELKAALNIHWGVFQTQRSSLELEESWRNSSSLGYASNSF